MAMRHRHRKLFPASTTNQTVDCPDICDLTCPYGCYPYSDISYMPPPATTPAGPTLSNNQGQHISLFVIIIATLLASFFVLVGYYAIVVKYYSRWYRFRPPPTHSDAPDDEFIDENRGPAIDHPIWYITTVGLQSSVINSITVVKYKKGDNLIEGTDCTVCLNEFQEDESLRLLPNCNHAFHIPCIDTWLRSHTNCPMCRSSILSNIWNAPLASNEATQMEISATEGELDMNQFRDGENRDRTEDEVEFAQVDDETKDIENLKDVISNRNGVFWVVDDLANDDMVIEDEIQAVRRSVSMDSPASIGLTETRFCNVGSEGSSVNPTEDIEKFDVRKMRHLSNSRIFRIMGGSSIAQSLHKGPVLMKRSFSYGGRSSLSRHFRSPNAILPL